jgi:poly-gamma-glutamate synthesis protein (capsule biosynthesis protein)
MSRELQAARERRAARRDTQRRARRVRAIRLGAVAGAFALLGALWVTGQVTGDARSQVETAATPAASAAKAAPILVAALPVSYAARAEAARDATITIIAVGDLLFDLAPKRLVAAEGGAAPLAKVAHVLRDGDITIGNLEGPLSNRGTKVAGKPDKYIFRGDPRSIDSLTTAGVDIVALANNHIMDYGAPALEDTIDVLDSAGVLYAGAGENLDAAWEPAYIERNGQRVAFISVSERIPSYFLAGKSTPGMASGRDMDRIVATIRKAKSNADYVIISSHWGVEQAYDCNSAQISMAHRFVDAGADMVLSHHPHVMQAVEFYKGKLIAYSLGNFLFPYKTVEGRKSMILRAEIGPNGIGEVSAVPVYLGDWGRPVVQTGSSAAGILGRLKGVSAKRGTDLAIKNDIGYLTP